MRAALLTDVRLSAAVALAAALVAAGCDIQNAAPAASPTPSAQASGPSIETVLTCSSKPLTGHPLLLASNDLQQRGTVVVFDVNDPVHPAPICNLGPAMGARFLTGARIAFWRGTQLGIADMATGLVTLTAVLPRPAAVGSINPNGTSFVYSVADDTNGSTTYLNVRGSDRVLYTRPPLGGHGGPPYGPLAQLAFSPDGRYLLAYDFFSLPGDPVEKFQVFGADGSLVFKSATAEFGAWAPSSDRLYFLQPFQPQNIAGDVHAWNPSRGETAIARDLASYFWPAVSPDGGTLAFTSFDASGLPHIWRLNLGSGLAEELSGAVGSKPIFVSSGLIWFDEEQRCECGPGGNSTVSGRLLAHDLISQRDYVVAAPDPLSGGDPTRAVLDVWLPS